MRTLTILAFMGMPVIFQGQGLTPDRLDFQWLQIKTAKTGTRPEETVIQVQVKPIVTQVEKNLWIITFPDTNLIGK